jgi:hypothetical protein
VPEDLSLAEHGELLTGLDLVLLAQIDEEPVAIHRRHQALDGRERVDDVLDHEPEGGAHLVRDPPLRPGRGDEQRGQQRRDGEAEARAARPAHRQCAAHRGHRRAVSGIR